MDISTASLFCGGGGEICAKQLAFDDLGIPQEAYTSLAINHWDVAVLASRANFPRYTVLREDLTKITADDYGITHLDLLWASPSCTHFSVARGGVPCSDQQRSHADEVIDRWLAIADVSVFLMENVSEFRTWGPLLTKDITYKGKRIGAGRPDPLRKGEFFNRFVARLQSLGYVVDHRVLCAADYGDCTTRKRFFLQAVKDGISITWPTPTHSKDGNGLARWRAAAEIIDWKDKGRSIFGRRIPLKPKTLARIKYGLIKYGLRPWLQHMTHTQSAMPGRSVDQPCPTITTARGGELALAEPCIIKAYGGGNTSPASDIKQPLPTVTAVDHNWLCEPYLVALRGTNQRQVETTATPVAEPIPTVSAGGRHAWLAQPFLTEYHTGSDSARRNRPMATPLPTADTSNRFGLVQPFLTEYYGTATASTLKDPLLTVTAKERHAVVQPTLFAAASSSFPMVRTEADIEALDMTTPFLIEFEGETYLVDVLYRLLKPEELAAAMGFPSWYQFSGNGRPLSKEDSVRLIGNACPVQTTRAIIREVVAKRPLIFHRKAA